MSSHPRRPQIDAWIFLVGSLGSTVTNVTFVYVLIRFPAFLRHVKAEGAQPDVVVRLSTFFELNVRVLSLSSNRGMPGTILIRETSRYVHWFAAHPRHLPIRYGALLIDPRIGRDSGDPSCEQQLVSILSHEVSSHICVLLSKILMSLSII